MVSASLMFGSSASALRLDFDRFLVAPEQAQYRSKIAVRGCVVRPQIKGRAVFFRGLGGAMQRLQRGSEIDEGLDRMRREPEGLFIGFSRILEVTEFM